MIVVGINYFSYCFRQKIDGHNQKMVELLEAHPLLKSKTTQGDASIPPKARQEYFYNRSSKFRFEQMLKEADRWCRKLPVLGFNSASFDVNLVREYLLPP